MTADEARHRLSLIDRTERLFCGHHCDSDAAKRLASMIETFLATAAEETTDAR